MLDERGRRKPNFREEDSVGVVFGDGQTWHVPKPWLEVRPILRENRVMDNLKLLTYGKDLDSIIDSLASARTFGDQIYLSAFLATHLLQWQYDLSVEEISELFKWRVGEPASFAWAQAVVAVATGQSGPKLWRDTGD